MFDETNMDRNDALGEQLRTAYDKMKPPPALEKAVRNGVPYSGKVNAKLHIRRFSKAVVSYVMCIVLLIGGVYLVSRLMSEHTPVATDPSQTTTSDTTTDPENPASDFKCRLNWDGAVTITKYTGTDLTVVIPERIDNKPVTQIADGAFAASEIVSVKMPDSITHIGGRAFFVCTNLTTVVLSSNVETIDSQAFFGCIKLSGITLPESLHKLGESAFQLCKALTYISIPKSVTEWGDGVFKLSGLETIELKEGLESIGQSAFDSTNLKEVVIPSSVKQIQRSAFFGCGKLEQVTLNEGLVSIDALAFNATKIREIVIPGTVENCNEFAFLRCDALQKVKFEGNAPAIFDNQDPNQESQYGQYLTSYTICYHEDAIGFTSPEWCGYPTEIW